LVAKGFSVTGAALAGPDFVSIRCGGVAREGPSVGPTPIFLSLQLAVYGFNATAPSTRGAGTL
jgi:hypothetical protein